MPSFGNSVDSSCAISSPLGPGMWLSSTSTSGCRSRTTRMVASPSPASPTSSMPCARESLNRISLRVASSSSATTTRMLIASLYGEPLAPEKGRRRERDGQRTGRDEEPRQSRARDDRSTEERPGPPAERLRAERRAERATLRPFVRGASSEHEGRGGDRRHADTEDKTQQDDDERVRLHGVKDEHRAGDERAEREHPASAAPIREAAEERRRGGRGECGRRERGADGELDREPRRPRDRLRVEREERERGRERQLRRELRQHDAAQLRPAERGEGRADRRERRAQRRPLH